MSFFTSLLGKYKIPNHDRRPLWKYFLTDHDFEVLCNELRYSKPYQIDARDAALYYAEWWKRSYNGGKPSKESVFNSLGGTIQYYLDWQEFYKTAKKGGQILGYKWIVKQNTLRFKTLLLQGGLPLTHIADNQGKYLKFLLAVLEEQPETIEDFIFQPNIINHLPKSSQNDIIYESCFEIVRSILNNESIYDELLNSDRILKNISGELKVRANQLQKKVRLTKPKNYWLLRKNKEGVNICLTLGLASKYTKEALKNILGIDMEEREYQLYVNDTLICVFKKMINGDFKTDWFNQHSHNWDGDDNFPITYIITDGKKIEVNNFIQTTPTFQEPTLWTKYSENEWRLIKGCGSTDKNAALLYPTGWNAHVNSEKMIVLNKEMNWIEFEGEIQIHKLEDNRKYFSDIESFDWTIVSDKPGWIVRSNMPIVRRKPKIYLYDNNNEIVPSGRFNLWLRKHKTKEPWQKLSQANNFPLGCIDIKIEKNNLVAYDMVYNIGNLNLGLNGTSIHKAIISIKALNTIDFSLDESPLLEISKRENQFNLKVKTSHFKIPTTIKGSMGIGSQRKLCFQMISPFQGMALINKDGNLIPEEENLSLKNLYGLRILTTPKKETILRIKNKVNSEVIISKVIKETFQPLIAFRDEIVMLYYLADAMDYKNRVCLELKDEQNKKTFEISGFSHTLDIDKQELKQVSLFESEDELDLYAIPLNGTKIDVTPVPLLRENITYKIPDLDKVKQWIVISSKEDGNQLMPRLVCTDANFAGIEKKDRIKNYGEQLLSNSFDSEIWKQLLTLFNICSNNSYDLPFSTFDQFRALTLYPSISAKAFLFLGVNQEDRDVFLQKDIPEMEKDLGMCFHWIPITDWEIAINEVSDYFGSQYFPNYVGIISEYMQEIGLVEIFNIMMNNSVNINHISHSDINGLRAYLGDRVLKELPSRSPRIANNYNIPINKHTQVQLLIQAPIAVAESIESTQNEYPIWGIDEIKNRIRRNIQYSQYLNPKFYNSIILHTLKQN